MARPKKLEQRKGFLVKLLPAEKQFMEQQAATCGLTLSEYVRRCAMNKKVRSRVTIQVIGELSRLGGLQKHLLMQIKSHPYEDELRGKLNSTLAELYTTLRALGKIAKE